MKKDDKKSKEKNKILNQIDFFDKPIESKILSDQLSINKTPTSKEVKDTS